MNEKDKKLTKFINFVSDDIIFEIAKYDINVLYFIIKPSNEIKSFIDHIENIKKYYNLYNEINNSLYDIKREIFQLEFLKNHFLLNSMIDKPTIYVENIINQCQNYKSELKCHTQYHHFIKNNLEYFHNYENIHDILIDLQDSFNYKIINIKSPSGYQIYGFIFKKNYYDDYYNDYDEEFNIMYENVKIRLKIIIENNQCSENISIPHVYFFISGFVNIVFDDDKKITQKNINCIKDDITNNMLDYIIDNNVYFDFEYDEMDVLKKIFSYELRNDHIDINSIKIKKILKLFDYLCFRTSKERIIPITTYIEDMKNDNKYIYYLTYYNENKYINSPIYKELIKNGREIIIIRQKEYECFNTYLRTINDTYVMNNLNTKIFVDVGKENVELDFEINNMLSKEEQDKLCSMLDKIYKQQNICKFTEIKCVNNINVVSKIKKREYVNESYLYINSRHKITKKLYDMINTNDNNKDIINLCKYIMNLGLINSHYSIVNLEEFIQYSNKLLLKSMNLE